MRVGGRSAGTQGFLMRAARRFRGVALFAAMSWWLAGCDLTDVPAGSGGNVFVTVATVVLTVDPAEPSRISTRAMALVSRSHQQVLSEVPGASVRITGASGRSMSLVEEADPLGACTVLSKELYEVDGRLEPIGSCHTASTASALFAPGEVLTLTVTTPDGSVLEGTSRMPDAFVPQGLSVEDGRCRVEPGTGYRFAWPRRRRGMGPCGRGGDHRSQSRICGRRTTPLYLPVTVLGRGREVTEMVFPGDFLLQLLSDVRHFELHRTLRAGLPGGSSADVVIAALDRNWANWIREGRANINGVVVIPSVFGDGTGMFGTAVRWKVSVESRETDGAGDVPLCGPEVVG